MTTFIGTAVLLTILACIPLMLLFAGRDTNHWNAIRRECQEDALLDWTDKDTLAAQHNAALRPAYSLSPAPKTIPVESIHRDTLSVA